jgi:hypothetical protein
MTGGAADSGSIPAFDRRFFASADLCTRVGTGALGGKAQGLLAGQQVIAGRPEGWGMAVEIPRMIVLATSVFDEFMAQNRLDALVAEEPDDERVAHAFQQASLPVEWLGDLRAIVEEVRQPLAVRSSSLLEDAMRRPFAGVYGTKMIPNNQPDADTRFHRLLDAIKFVYASTFFRAARSYRRAAAVGRDEKMGVLIQEVVGSRYGDRFYPAIAGVAKSYNFYPSGSAQREDGVVLLALGLGKTIVDGERCWVYAPSRPAAAPPYGSVDELLDSAQQGFWAVNMGPAPAYDPMVESEYLVQAALADAEYDGTLALVASTYDPGSDRLYPGIGRVGPRAIDFAPVLKLEQLALNTALASLLDACSTALAAPVEIEFAVACAPDGADARLGFLQVRPMAVSTAPVAIADAEWASPSIVAASDRALGNGTDTTVRDIVYVHPDRFEARHTHAIAAEIGRLNDRLMSAGRPYVLVVIGRLGSSDPWLGIPVAWGDVAGARVIVEATLPAMDVEASQGAHFFHNLSAFQVSFLTVPHTATPGVDWRWLHTLPAVDETAYVRHVRAERPLVVKVDGRSGRGAIWRAE